LKKQKTKKEIKLRKHDEDDEQKKIFEWSAWKEKEFPVLETMLFHVPNGGKRNIREAVRLKRQGVKAGIPDIYLDVPNGKYHGLRIELKVAPNKPTKNQIKYIDMYNELGYKAVFCYSADKAIDIICEYLKIKNI